MGKKKTVEVCIPRPPFLFNSSATCCILVLGLLIAASSFLVS
jgi:hypothetical protein